MDGTPVQSGRAVRFRGRSGVGPVPIGLIPVGPVLVGLVPVGPVPVGFVFLNPRNR